MDKLRHEGHDVEEIKFPGNGAETYALYVALAAAEGDMRCFHEGLEGEVRSFLGGAVEQKTKYPYKMPEAYALMQLYPRPSTSHTLLPRRTSYRPTRS